MVINIWNSDETMAAFVDDWASAVHTEVLNGENTLTAALPIKHDKATLLVEGNYLGFYDNDDNYQMFEIYEIRETHLIREAICEHVVAELNSEIVEDSRPYNQTAETALGLALADTRWTEGTVADLGLNSANFYYESARSCIAKIINTWGGELRFRLVFDGNTITHRYVDILETRGSVTGKRFEYGKDINEITRQVSMDGLITACYGRGKGEEVGVNDDGKTTYGRRLTFADVVWTTPTDEVDKPADQTWVGDDAAKALYGYAGGTRHRYGVFLDDEETDDETLLEKTWAYLQENNTPKTTYDLDVMLLESLSGYSHEAVRLGDTVALVDSELNLALSARVIKLEWNLLNPEQSAVRLGNYVDALSGTVLDTITHVDRYRDRQAFYDDGSTRATDGLDASGYVDLPVYGSKIVGTSAEDGLNMTNTHMGYYNAAQSAWRAFIDNSGQFLFQKDANNYFMYDGTNFTFRGPLVADDITTGTLAAARVQIGSGTSFDTGYDPTDKADQETTATIDTKDVTLKINTTDGFAVYDGATWRGGVKVVNGKVALVSDVIANAADLDQYIDYELVDADLYGMRFFTPESGSPVQTLGIYTYTSTDNRVSHIGAMSGGSDRWATLSLYAADALNDSPGGSSHITLKSENSSYKPLIQLYAVDTSENSGLININHDSIEMKIDLTTVGEWTSSGLAVTGSITEDGTALSSKYLALSGGTMTGQLNMGSNNIVGSTSDCWITARRIGLGVAANSTYTVDASTGYIRAGKYYSGSSGGLTTTITISADGYDYNLYITGGIVTGWNKV